MTEMYTLEDVYRLTKNSIDEVEREFIRLKGRREAFAEVLSCIKELIEENNDEPQN